MFLAMLFYIICSFYFSTVQAVIVRVDILKGKNSKTGKEQLVYLLGDYHNLWHHDSMTLQMSQQKKELLTIFSGYNKDKIKCVIEGFRTKNKLLGVLKEPISDLGVEIVNVEFRKPTHRISSRMLESLDYKSIKQRMSLKLEQAFNGLDDIATSIPNCFAKEYEKVKDDVIKKANFTTSILLPKMEDLGDRFFLQKHLSFEFFNQPFFDKENHNSIHYIDARILDLKILCEIANAANKETIFVISGEFHTRNIHNILKEHGYDSIFTCKDPTKRSCHDARYKPKLKNMNLEKFLMYKNKEDVPYNLPRRSERLRKKRKRVSNVNSNKRRKLNSGLKK